MYGFLLSVSSRWITEVSRTFVFHLKGFPKIILSLENWMHVNKNTINIWK